MSDKYPPEHLCFERKTGARYFEYGREVGGYPNYATKVFIKSLKTGARREMSESDFLEFKSSSYEETIIQQHRTLANEKY